MNDFVVFLLVNAIILGALFGLYKLTDTRAGVGDAIGAGIVLVFVIPIVDAIANLITALVLKNISWYLLVPIVPLLIPAIALLGSKIKKMRYSYHWNKAIVPVRERSMEVLKKYDIEADKERIGVTFNTWRGDWRGTIHLHLGKEYLKKDYDEKLHRVKEELLTNEFASYDIRYFG